MLQLLHEVHGALHFSLLLSKLLQLGVIVRLVLLVLHLRRQFQLTYEKREREGCEDIKCIPCAKLASYKRQGTQKKK